MNKESLQKFFETRFAVYWADENPEELFEVFHDDALIVDEDTPFIFNKDEYREHMDFHMSGIWERFAWKPRDIDFRVIGSSGLISGNYSIHGKPKSAGYRQRDGMFSIVCQANAKEEWQVLKFHCSSLFSAINHNSPG